MKWLEDILKKHTDENGVLNMESLMAEVNKEAPKYTVPKEVYNTLSNDKKALDKKVKEYEDAQLTDDDKRQKEIDDANARASELLIKFNRSEAEKILIAAGMSEEDYTGFIDGIVTEDETATKTIVTSMANTFKAKLEANAVQVKNDLLKNTQHPDGGNGDVTPKKTEAETFAKSLAEMGGAASQTSKEALDYYNK